MSNSAGVYRAGFLVYMGIMESKMETTIVYWGYMGVMEKKMEITIVGFKQSRDGLWVLAITNSPGGWNGV